MATLKKVKVLFSNVLNVDDFSQRYQVVVEMDEGQAADAEAAGLKVKTKEYEGKPQFQAAFKTKFRPRVVSRDGQTNMELTGEVGRGSLVCIQYKFRDFTNQTTKVKGTSQDLIAVQVLDLKDGGSTDFDDEGENFGDEGDSEY